MFFKRRIKNLLSRLSRQEHRRGVKAKKTIEKCHTVLPQADTLEVKEEDPIVAVACDLGVELDLIKAFIMVESGSRHWYNHKLIINYEAHYFKRESGEYVPDANVIRIGDPFNQKDEWNNFEKAKVINEEAAYRSISMGKFQIMGANYRQLGYDSAKEMFEKFNTSESEATYAFGAFIKNNKRLWRALKEKDYHLMAYYYNGSKYKKYVDRYGRTYDERIKLKYEELLKRGS
jgi:hypothetical protein